MSAHTALELSKPAKKPKALSASGPRALSFGPESLWYLDKVSPGNPVYNVPFLAPLHGHLDVHAFEQALNELVQRQDVLRTIFPPHRGTPAAYVLNQRQISLKRADFRNSPEPERGFQARARAREEASRPFDLTRDAMLRAFLFQLADCEYLFLFVTHHIVFELGSLAVLYRDLSRLYNGLVTGEPAQVPELRFHDSDFVAWQRRTLQGPYLEKLQTFWKEQLSGAPRIDLPLDFPRPRVHTHRGVRHHFDMSPSLIIAANAFSRSAGTTVYRGLLAAFYIFLSCCSGAKDICVGSPFASRWPGIKDTIGFFANTLVLRSDLSGSPTFREVIAEVDRLVMQVLLHSDLSFEKIVELVQPPRDPGRTPVFQISFRGRAPYAQLTLNSVVSGPTEFLDNGTAKFDLAFELECSTGKSCFIEYCSDLFKRETIVRMKNEFQEILGDLIRHPDHPFTDLATSKKISERYSKQAANNSGTHR